MRVRTARSRESGAIDDRHGRDAVREESTGSGELALEETLNVARGLDEGTDSEVAGTEPGAGSVYGRYVLLHRVGAGAMGVVHAAWDPELGRKVALKLLRAGAERGNTGEADGAGRLRLLREAQALARLSHPNVVAVHDVGAIGDQVWLAMEFVAGQTLRAWCTERRRGWREVLTVLRAAGEGLAAAHEAGIVHRDFKPDNVMVGDDGRVRVMDLGLARLGDEPDVEVDRRARRTPTGALLTQAGSMVGTPAYMAPEQLRGHVAGTAADLFAYCVTAWEALFGERPFVGRTLFELAENVDLARQRTPPRGHAVPGWLRRLLERGLAADADRRWPSMRALLREMSRGQTRARARQIGAALLVFACSVGGGWAHHAAGRAAQIAGCEAAGAAVEVVWNDAARARIRSAFVATGASYAAVSAEKVAPWLERQALQWRAALTRLCVDATVEQTLDASALDRALWCLDERKIELETLVVSLAEVDRSSVLRAVRLAASLDPVTPCEDPARWSRTPAPSQDGRAAAREIRSLLASVKDLASRADYAAGRTLAHEALARAVALGWPPLIAAAKLRLGALLRESGQHAEAERALGDAYFEAVRAGASGVAVEAALELVNVIGVDLARHAEGVVWSRHAEAWIRELEPEDGLWTARLLHNLAIVRQRAGEFAASEALQKRELALLERSLGADHPLVAEALNNLATLRLDLGSFAEAQALQLRALAMFEASLGPEHPNVAIALDNLANILHVLGAGDEADALAERALAIRERAFGPVHPAVADSLHNLAIGRLEAGARADARTFAARALAIREQVLPPGHPDLADSLGVLAGIDHGDGDLAAARVKLERALVILERSLGPNHPNIASTLHNLALVDRSAAVPWLERALSIRERALGPRHVRSLEALVRLAEAELRAGRSAAARGRFERALAALTATAEPDADLLGSTLLGLAMLAIDERRFAEASERATRAVQLRERDGGDRAARARFALARAQWGEGTKESRPRALESARLARADAEDPELRAEIDRWLARPR